MISIVVGDPVACDEEVFGVWRRFLLTMMLDNVLSESWGRRCVGSMFGGG